ncbi:DUF3604 domain-containing protein [Candidatus Hepatincola sp. Av]
MRSIYLIYFSLAILLTNIANANTPEYPKKHVYFGQTHLHTNLSGDAFALGNIAVGPDEAYRFMKGQPVLAPLGGFRVQQKRALDFGMVSDHAEYMGLLQQISKNSPDIRKSKMGKKFIEQWNSGNYKEKRTLYWTLMDSVNKNKPYSELFTKAIRQPVWNKIINAAEKYNEPGKFTTFVAWEWSSLPNGANLHRVIIMKDKGSKAKQFLPYSSFDSDKPEDLWKFLETTTKKYGVSMLAIPHNSNLSNGLMFSEKDSYGHPIDVQYAKTRMKWEPVVEITQMKGDSETSPDVSPNDEFANYEKYEHLMVVDKSLTTKSSDKKANYIRSSLKRGLEIEDKIGTNPYKFGVVGGADSHSGLSTTAENQPLGKFAQDLPDANKGTEIMPGVTGWDISSAGLAAVYAEENTRSAIFNAIQRKETYATTGTFITLQVFAGWDYAKNDASSKNFADIGYSNGVSMGGDLAEAPNGEKIKLLIRASKDPDGANLDRIQVVKGWLDANGKSHEKVYNVAWSKGRGTNPAKIKPVGNTVDLTTAKYTNTIGASELYTLWEDKEFDPTKRAFYYVRVLEIPTPRNSLFSALALGLDHNKVADNHPATIQERAYSSPIWYTP